MSAFVVLRWLSLLVDVSVKSLALLAAAGLVRLLLRRASAASRHRVWLLAIGSLLSLPLLSATLPEWPVRAWPYLVPVARVLSPEATRRPGLRRPAPSRVLSVLVRRAPLSQSRPLSSTARPLRRVALLRARRDGPAPLPLPSGLFFIWLVGAGLVLAQWLVGMARVRRLGKQCRCVTEGPLAAMAGGLARELGLRRPVTLLMSRPETGPIVPMTWGFRRPVVLLPGESEEWPESRLRSVLLHELAHVQRRDWPAQLLTCLTCALYWFHPLVWLAARQLRIESERACDDRVLATGVMATDYASHLLEIVRSLRGSERALRAALTIVPRSPIELRVRAILERQRNRREAPRWAALPASLIVFGVLIPLAAVRPGGKPSPRHSSGGAVPISVVERQANGIRARESRRGTLVAIVEESERPLLPRCPSKRRSVKALRTDAPPRPSPPREGRHPRSGDPPVPRPRNRPRAPNRLVAGVPKAVGSPAAAAPAPPDGAEPAPGPAPERPEAVPAADAVLADFVEPAVRDAGDGDTATSTLILAVAEDPRSGAARTPGAEALPAGQPGTPTVAPAAVGSDQTVAPRELELEPDTDVLPAAGQDRDALSAPSADGSTPREPSAGQPAPLDEGGPGPAHEAPALDRPAGGVSAVELLVWDRTRQCWDRVLLVWDRTLASPDPKEGEEEWTPDLDPGGSLFEPGSLDEELWFWDRTFEHWDQEPAREKRGPARGLPCPASLLVAA